MDTSWIELPNNHPSYHAGAVKFIELAKEGLVDGKTLCPCKKCKVKNWLSIQEVEEHIMFKGFDKQYKKWIFHGKGDVLERILSDQRRTDIDATRGPGQGSSNSIPGVIGQDDMRGLLGDAFGVNISPNNESLDSQQFESHDQGLEDQSDQPPLHEPTPPAMDEKEKAKFEKLLEASSKGLYEGCTTFSKLSFLLRLFHIICKHHLSIESFNMFLELLTEAFPQIMEFPSSYYEGKNLINYL